MSYYGQPRNDFSQNPAFFDAFSQQSSPYNFYFNPPNIEYKPFIFAKRISRLDYEMMGNIDVVKISQTGDIQFIMSILYPIVFSNITQVEAQQFGSRGALHSFMILQMAVEYYLYAVGQLTWEVHQLKKGQKNQNKIPDESDQRTKAMYESQIQILKSDIKERDMIIENLSEKYSNLLRDRDSLKCQLNSLKKRNYLHKIHPKELEPEDSSEGEIVPPPQLNIGPSNKSKPAAKRTKNTNPEKSLQKTRQPPRQSTKSKRPQNKYRDLNSKSSQSQSQTSEEQEQGGEQQQEQMISFSSTSSSGWT